MFGARNLPRSVRIAKVIDDCPEVKLGYVYTFNRVGYYEGPTCKVFMPHRIKQLLKDKQVEDLDGKNNGFGGASGNASCELNKLVA